MQPLPDQASMDTPQDPAQIIVVPEWPTPGKRYLVERDGQQEIWLVKDNNGTIEFIDSSTQQTKFSVGHSFAPQIPETFAVSFGKVRPSVLLELPRFGGG